MTSGERAELVALFAVTQAKKLISVRIACPYAIVVPENACFEGSFDDQAPPFKACGDSARCPLRLSLVSTHSGISVSGTTERTSPGACRPIQSRATHRTRQLD